MLKRSPPTRKQMKQKSNAVSFTKDLDDVLSILTEQMIKDNFQNKSGEEDKYIITKQDLYKFSIKLIKVVRGVYGEN